MNLLPLLVILALAQEAPAQPPAEAEVAARFEVAIPDLFKEWLALRPAALKASALGVQKGVPASLGSVQFIFIECTDAAPPSIVSFDVRKTGSVLAPFVGIIRVHTSESCLRRPIWASGWAGKEKQEALIPSCDRKPYDECVKARGKPMPEKYDLPFHYDGDITLSYRWTKGSWEFESEELKAPRQFPESEQKDPLVPLLSGSGSRPCSQVMCSQDVA